MFLSDVATAAKQVFILYILVLLGFICDRTKIYTEKAARLTNDLLFYIVTPAIIIQSFSSVEMSGENVRGMLMSFLGRNDFARRCNSDLYSVLAQDRQKSVVHI
ncbi:MAG: AEC family transporter [Acutalibacteraceae bacterium]